MTYSYNRAFPYLALKGGSIDGIFSGLACRVLAVSSREFAPGSHHPYAYFNKFVGILVHGVR